MKLEKNTTAVVFRIKAVLGVPTRTLLVTFLQSPATSYCQLPLEPSE